MGAVGAVGAVGMVGVVGMMGAVRVVEGGSCGRGGNDGLCQSPRTLTKCGDAIIDDCEL